jgi:hypothetical protein
MATGWVGLTGATNFCLGLPKQKLRLALPNLPASSLLIPLALGRRRGGRASAVAVDDRGEQLAGGAQRAFDGGLAA